MLLFVTVILVCSASVVFAEGIINQNCSVFFSVNGGLYQKPSSLTLSTDLENAQIYYTTDGSIPSSSSTKYTAAVAITGTQTLKAVAVKSGMLPSYFEETYTNTTK